MTKKTITRLALPAVMMVTLAAAAAVTIPAPTGNNILELSKMDLSPITYFDDAGKTAVRANRSTLDNPIAIKDTIYASGIGTHAPSVACFRLNGATRFEASLGIDDEADQKPDHGIVNYEIVLYKGSSGQTVMSGTITRDDRASVKINLPLGGYDFMKINLKEGAQKWADHVDLGNAFFTYSGTQPETINENQIGQMGNPSSGIVQPPTTGSDGAAIITLSSLDMNNVTVGWGTLKNNKTIENNTLTLAGVKYASGVGVHATSRIVVKLNGAVTKFHTVCGIDDEVGNNGQVAWKVWLLGEGGDTKTAAQGTARGSDNSSTEVNVDCLGWKYLVLDADKDGADSYDHFDWANAYFEYIEQNSTPPVTVPVKIIEGGLDCATTYFATPGVRMMQFLNPSDPDAQITVSGLPAGLSFDSNRNAVTGVVDTEGEYTYIAKVATPGGEEIATPVKLIVSSSLELPTPMMGWLSWNVVQGDISTSVVKTVADAMVESGLQEAGYDALIIDDLWHASARNADGTPKEDPAKFPNGMKEAADYTHSKGLRFGIYSDAGTRTCAGRFGSFGSEQIDANQYAKWGVDILKYDYCNAPGDLETCKTRYKAMADALKASGRDITLLVCEWGVREPWKWGAEIGSSLWRSTYDTRDCWNGVGGGVGILQSIEGMKNLWPYSGPNRFNDADMMCVGIHGTGKSSSDLCGGKAGMTQDEYRTQMSLWCMWASPLFLSFDLRKPITDDDLAILTNKELIAINQDPMGLAAQYLGEKDGMQLYAKDLENGDIAVAVVNLNATAGNYTINFDEIPALAPATKYHFRDLWAHENLGVQNTGYTINVPSHATRVFRLVDEASAGIESIEAASAGAMKVTTSDSKVSVSIPGTAGASKRVVVSDVSGRVVGVATGADETVTLDVNAVPGSVLMVRVITLGTARTLKTIL